jgi:hypothetical protein
LAGQARRHVGLRRELFQRHHSDVRRPRHGRCDERALRIVDGVTARQETFRPRISGRCGGGWSASAGGARTRAHPRPARDGREGFWAFPGPARRRRALPSSRWSHIPHPRPSAVAAGSAEPAATPYWTAAIRYRILNFRWWRWCHTRTGNAPGRCGGPGQRDWSHCRVSRTRLNPPGVHPKRLGRAPSTPGSIMPLTLLA